jgi:hypothetical protein
MFLSSRDFRPQEIQWLGREADHSPPTILKVKQAWSYTSTPQSVFMAWSLIKRRNNFIFYNIRLIFFFFFLCTIKL